MRIKRLDLCGFKSFVDPTTLDFSKGISGIVGPNGCGKSNLVDALRWVLGEQSAKRLRGTGMEDVIFNGTSSGRGPAGMAEVSLLLENEEPHADTEEPSEIWRELRDVPEIQVTRRYFRSGESEYLINNRPCRLKDVTELFLGTGVGTKAYAMIEQGRVDQLVNAKPEDIRLFIEEAAGTTLYRDRRLAAERKMERTRDNLARVSDILQEIDRNIAFYRRLAKKAEQYRQWQQELRAVDLQVTRRRYDRLQADVAALAARRERLRERDEALAVEIARLDESRSRSRQTLEVAEEALRERQNALYETRSARERAQTGLEMLAREERDASAQLERIERDREQTDGRAKGLASEIEQRRGALADLAARNRESAERLAASAGELAGEEKEVSALDADVERAKTDNLERQRTEAELANRIRAAAERREQRATRRRELTDEIANAELEVSRLTAEAERLASERDELERKITAAREESARLTHSGVALRSEKAMLEEAALAAATALAESESRLAAAEEVERSYGKYQEGVQAVMRKHAEKRNGVLNLVAEVIDTPPEFEKAVAAVLGERLQYVVVRSPEDARDAIRELKEANAGRSNFVPLEPRRPHLVEVDSSAGPRAAGTGLLDVVRVEEGYGALAETLLGDAYLVDDLDRGLEVWRRNGHWRTLVTPEGEVLAADGVVSGGSAGRYEEHLLAQRREIRRLRAEAAHLGNEVAGIEKKRAEKVTELAAAERRSTAIEEQIRSLSIERVGVGKDAERLAQDAGRTSAMLERSRNEDARLARELDGIAADAAEAERQVAVASAERTRGDEWRREAQATLATRRSALAAKAAAATDLKVALAQSREKEDALRQGLEQMSAQCRELVERARELAGEAAAIRERAERRAEERATLGATVAERSAEEASRQAEYEGARTSAESLRAEIETAERQLAETREELDRVRRERGEHDLAHAEQDMRRQHLVDGIRERYQIELDTVALAEGEEAELEARLQSLSQKVDRADRATVGLEAMEELGPMEERRTFLAKEKSDLEQSIADLQKTISNLNRMSRDRFAEAFAAVNEKFQETFPKLFRGGRARLLLTDENDLMETGVDIEVQPPGMNLRALSLLSGGQKALTAVSLIFSLFMCRPSPFCVLDEVDAPLDDANIDRFNDMVRHMGAESQFLLITHNQRTMDVTDRLYGVTMEEPGVSKIVSVRLQASA
jgi:chromosome segregation protein